MKQSRILLLPWEVCHSQGYWKQLLPLAVVTIKSAVLLSGSRRVVQPAGIRLRLNVLLHVQEIQKSALEALTDLLLQQLGDLGSASSSHANLAGRTDRNINDVVSVPCFHAHHLAAGRA